MFDFRVQRFALVLGGIVLLALVGLSFCTEWQQREVLDTHIVADLDDDDRQEVALFRSEVARDLWPGPEWIEVLEPESGRVRWRAGADETNGKTAEQVAARGGYLVAPTLRSYRSLFTFDLSAREVAWRTSTPNAHDSVERPVDQWMIVGEELVLLRYRDGDDVKMTARHLATGDERWTISDRELSVLGRETRYRITHDRIYQMVGGELQVTRRYDAYLRVIESDTGEHWTISGEAGAVTGEGVLMTREVERSDLDELGGWSPSTSGGSNASETNEDSSATVRVLWRVPHDGEEPELMTLGGRPIRLPECETWTAHAGRIVCLYRASLNDEGDSSSHEFHLVGVPYRPGAEGFAWRVPGRPELVAGPAWREHRKHPIGFYRFRHRHVLFEMDRDSGHRFVLFDLDEGRPVWTSAPFTGRSDSALVSREGTLVMSFVPKGDVEDGGVRAPLVASFNLKAGRWLGAVRPIDTRHNEPLTLSDVQVHVPTVGGNRLANRTPAFDSVWVLDIRRLALVYGPRIRLHDVSGAWREYFEDIPEHEQQ